MTNNTPTSPLTIHTFSQRQALPESTWATATPLERDAAIAQWARQRWHALPKILPGAPHQQHALVVHPENAGDSAAPDGSNLSARIFIVTQQIAGWLYSPLCQTDLAPRWHANSLHVLLHAAHGAARQGFCTADALVLGMAAVLAGNAPCTAVNGAKTQMLQRSHFPLLGNAPRAQAFAPMSELLQTRHAYGLYPVMGDAAWTVRCLDMGTRLVQLRLKNTPPDALDESIARCAAAAHRHGAHLFINDHWQAALCHARQAPGIYGVHLGQDDVQALDDATLNRLQASGLRLGISSQTLWQLARALHLRPSYVACGPVHATATKDVTLPPVGENSLRFWAHIVHGSTAPQHPPLPLVAIGGMNAERACRAAAAGADSIAVVSAITQAPDTTQAIAALQQAIAAGLEQRNARL